MSLARRLRPEFGFCIGLAAAVLMALGVAAAPAGSRAAGNAGNAGKKGLAIMQEADRRDRGWTDTTARVTMLLKNRQGRESRRDLRIRSLEVEGDGDRTVVIFDTPRDVKGTALLTFSHKAGSDDQWLYLPALKRVKRIASDNQSGPFMGSEFAYEDMTSPEVEKYTYRYLRDDSPDGVPSFVVERFPVDSNSGYSRQVLWLDKAEYRVRKIAFYDRRNSLLKTLTLSDYRQYLKKFWRPDTSYMVNHQTGKSTLLTYRDFRFKTGLNERDFHRNRLKTVR